jgi:hypothetical protein
VRIYVDFIFELAVYLHVAIFFLGFTMYWAIGS